MLYKNHLLRLEHPKNWQPRVELRLPLEQYSAHKNANSLIVEI